MSATGVQPALLKSFAVPGTSQLQLSELSGLVFAATVAAESPEQTAAVVTVEAVRLTGRVNWMELTVISSSPTETVMDVSGDSSCPLVLLE